jgi:hypothetical protein
MNCHGFKSTSVKVISFQSDRIADDRSLSRILKLLYVSGQADLSFVLVVSLQIQKVSAKFRLSKWFRIWFTRFQD